MPSEFEKSDKRILDEICFGFFQPYKLAGMGEPWASKLDETLMLLKTEGIGAILTLTEEDPYGERYRDTGLLHHHEPIDDCEPPSSFDSMDRAVAFIDGSLAQDCGVAVHCLEGRGRTGTVLAAWVGLKEKLDQPAAVERVYAGRFHTIITPSQRAFLEQYLNAKGKPHTMTR